MPVTTGYKYWWVKNFLEYARTAYCIQPADHTEAVALFRKVLRGYGSFWGRQKADDVYKLADFSFPIMPVDDIDMWMGVWIDNDAAFIINLIELLINHDIRILSIHLGQNTIHTIRRLGNLFAIGSKTFFRSNNSISKHKK